MSDTKMLQAILERVSLIDRKVDKGFNDVYKKIDDLDKKLTLRLDKQGKSLAYLEDDAPTRKEFSNLEKRVEKIEVKTAM